jgi:hypothetical protein
MNIMTIYIKGQYLISIYVCWFLILIRLGDWYEDIESESRTVITLRWNAHYDRNVGLTIHFTSRCRYCYECCVKTRELLVERCRTSEVSRLISLQMIFSALYFVLTISVSTYFFLFMVE